jgi:hypothetical protein
MCRIQAHQCRIAHLTQDSGMIGPSYRGWYWQ